jgi:hypothetical protein
MCSESVCQVARSWVEVRSFYTRLFGVVYVTSGDFHDGSEKETGKSHRVPNQESMVGGGMTAILFFARNCWMRTEVWDGALSWWSSQVCSRQSLGRRQDPGHKFGCDTVHAQFFRQNPLACPITNSHLLSNVVNCPTSILMDELLNLCNSFRSCAACGSPCVFVINWRATSLEPGMPLKHPRTTQALVPKGLLNHCEGLCTTFPKIGTKFDAHTLSFSRIHRENHHRSRTRLQINACKNCALPPS